MDIEQRDLIRKGDWDYLIVLDACRYDFFEIQVNDFFQGELLKTRSAGSCTLDWCKNTFSETGFSDVVYVSSNPYINSKKELKSFRASKVFKKVIDVWLTGWDDELETVHPRKVTEAAQKELYNPNRMIIHYLQPHAPYIVDKYKIRESPITFKEMNNFLNIVHDRNSEKKIKQNIADKISPKIRAKVKTFYLYYLQLLGRSPYSPLDDIRRRFGVDGLRDAYTLNLSMVLEEASKMFEIIIEEDSDAKVIVTSDHGEALGEGIEFAHMCGRDSEVLLSIPWFRVEMISNNRLNALREK